MESSDAVIANFTEESEELLDKMEDSTNSTESDNICEMCFQNFASHEELNRHLSIHTLKQKIFQCSFCEKLFSTNQQRKDHERIHTKEKPYECAYCPKSFARVRNLKEHEKRHINEKKHKCNICSRAFTLESYLVRHVKRHAGEKNFKCNFCPKCFTTNEVRKTHERLHTGEKPYSCNSCPKTFSSMSSKNSHEFNHALTKDYTCERCNKSFKNPYTCRNHEKEGKCESAMIKLSKNLTEISKMEANEASKKMEADKSSKKMEADKLSKKMAAEKLSKRFISNAKKYTCDKCDTSFNRPYMLIGHKNKGCMPRLKPKFETFSKQIQENKKQSYPCDFCPKILISSNKKIYHEATAHSSKENISEKIKTDWKFTTFWNRNDSNFDLNTTTSSNTNKEQNTSDLMSKNKLDKKIPNEATAQLPKEEMKEGKENISEKSKNGWKFITYWNKNISLSDLNTNSSSKTNQEQNTSKYVSKNEPDKIISNVATTQSKKGISEEKLESNLKTNISQGDTTLYIGDKSYHCEFCSNTFTSIFSKRQHVMNKHVGEGVALHHSKDNYLSTLEPNLEEELSKNEPEKQLVITIHASKNLSIHQSKEICLSSLEPNLKDLSKDKPKKQYVKTASKNVAIQQSKENYLSSIKPNLENLSKNEPNQNLTANSSDKKTHKCYICEQKFTRSYLKQHEKTHSKPYICEHCPKSYSTKLYLKDHEKTHLDEKPYKCDICLKSFTSQKILRRHVKRHSGEKNFKCNFCSKSFVTNFTKKVHERLHTSEKPFSCNFCPKMFSSSSGKLSHEISHASKKGYTCDRCKKSWKRYESWKYHQTNGNCDSC